MNRLRRRSLVGLLLATCMSGACMSLGRFRSDCPQALPAGEASAVRWSLPGASGSGAAYRVALRTGSFSDNIVAVGGSTFVAKWQGHDPVVFAFGVDGCVFDARWSNFGDVARGLTDGEILAIREDVLYRLSVPDFRVLQEWTVPGADRRTVGLIRAGSGSRVCFKALDQQAIIVVDARTMSEVCRVPIGSRMVGSFAPTTDGQHLYETKRQSGADASTYELWKWDLGPATPSSALVSVRFPVDCHVTAAGRFLWMGTRGQRGKIGVLDTRSDELIAELNCGSDMDQVYVASGGTSDLVATVAFRTYPSRPLRRVTLWQRHADRWQELGHVDHEGRRSGGLGALSVEDLSVAAGSQWDEMDVYQFPKDLIRGVDR